MATSLGKGMKKTKSYKFKEVDLVGLRELALKVKNQTGFRFRYGGLLPILRTNVEEKLVHTLVQFYDPSFRCFTFPDFQLVPTLEAYSHLLGLPIAEKTPFIGPGTSLTPLVIAKRSLFQDFRCLQSSYYQVSHSRVHFKVST
ncbi:hypothetical protein MTR_6g073790 [Medicago truncatula]|uniref:DUF7745 domain-containing protein n=1 Tax=Medicago truncatula TaxID=3880 RepID=G7KIK0_MEDTR|nr:hypothetical protein MTR_6g073790 [Medicago truncatula]